jgi:hypothetical protein
MRRTFTVASVVALSAGCGGSSNTLAPTLGNDGGSLDGTTSSSSGTGSGSGSGSSGSGSGSSSGASGSSSGASGSGGGDDSGSDAGSGGDDGSSDDSGEPTTCVINGKTLASGALLATNSCESCQPDITTTTWSDVVDGTTCGTGGICHTGTCVSGCEVGSVYYTTNSPDPSNACMSCQPGKSTSAFSAIQDGTGCGNSQVCSSGECGTQCDIGGTIYATGTANPSNACQTCQPGVSTSAFTNVSPGLGCNGSGTCGSGGVCAMPASCAAGGFGMTNCGSGSESCCTSIEIPGGNFHRTYANTGTGPTSEANLATVSSFRMDKYLVTVGRFR